MVDTRGGNPGNLAHDIPQYKLWQILFMFAWPAVWFSFLIYIVGRQFIPEGGVTPTWVMLAVIVLGAGAELAVGLVLLRREGYSLTFAALRDRIRWKWPKGWRARLTALGVLVAGMALSLMMGGAIRALAAVRGFIPPDWWPAASNPTVQVSSVADAFPDMALQGNYLFVLLYFVVGLVFNIFGEELYYRGFLMPKMRAVFGSCVDIYSSDVTIGLAGRVCGVKGKYHDDSTDRRPSLAQRSRSTSLPFLAWLRPKASHGP